MFVLIFKQKLTGSSKGSDIPVNFSILPSRANLYKPFTSLFSQTSNEVLTQISLYSPPVDSINSLLNFLSSSYGAIFAQITTPPCFTISLATYPILLTFVLLSSFEKPNPLLKFCLTISPSNIVIVNEGSFSNNFVFKIFA